MYNVNILITEKDENKQHKIYDKIFNCLPKNKHPDKEYDSLDGYFVSLKGINESQLKEIKQIKGLRIQTNT